MSTKFTCCPVTVKSNAAFGGTPRETGTNWLLLDWPAAFVTTSMTGYVAALRYVCDGLRSLLVCASPKSHAQPLGEPVEASAKRTVRPFAAKVKFATGRGGAATIGRLSAATAVPAAAMMFAVPAAAPGKNRTAARPPTSVAGADCTGFPALSKLNAPRLVFRVTGVPSGAGEPSACVAVRVMVAGTDVPAVSWARSVLTDSDSGDCGPPGAVGSATGFPSLLQERASASSPAGQRRSLIFISNSRRTTLYLMEVNPSRRHCLPEVPRGTHSTASSNRCMDGRRHPAAPRRARRGKAPRRGAGAAVGADRRRRRLLRRAGESAGRQRGKGCPRQRHPARQGVDRPPRLESAARRAHVQPRRQLHLHERRHGRDERRVHVSRERRDGAVEHRDGHDQHRRHERHHRGARCVRAGARRERR